MTTPKISVVMPAYNAEKHIAEAIESILNQTFTDFELLIIDDASTDKTFEIAKDYADKDSRIKIIRNTENLNIGGSLNKGISEAKAEIIARMDADDISLPDRFQKQYDLLQSDPKIAVVGGDIIVLEEDWSTHIRKYESDSDKMKKLLVRYMPFAHPATMYRKQPVVEAGMYDPKKSPSEDMNLWIRLGAKYKFGSVPSPIFKYRMYSTSSSNKKLRKVELNTIKMRIEAVTKYNYKFDFMDILFNILQLATMWISAKHRIKLFNFLRHKNLI